MSASIDAHNRRKVAEAELLNDYRQSLRHRLENSNRDLAIHTGLTEAVFKAVVKAHYDQLKPSSSKFPGNEEDARAALEALIHVGRMRYAAGASFGDIRKEGETYRLPQTF